MQVINRKDNPLLNRVEIRFMWDHPNSPTPDLSQMITAAAKAEPGAKEDLVFIKDVSSRFGMPRTTGLALIYSTEEASSIEPNFIVERHKRVRGSDSDGNPSKDGGDE
ncbi:MAG: hypothetical protein L7R66_02235 [Candidatus Thalassarchaeaceae archaeon]|jgi:small subunit ribosomal protein S24e|nr:hypothetical protein [Candidatus Thalassarchaeaceae archaeon]